MRRWLLWVALATAGATLALAAEPSHANFEGKNGLLLFARYPHHHQQLFTVKPDGTGVRQVTHFATGDAFDGQWSPDGKRIAFTHHWGNHFKVTFVNADGTGLLTLPTLGQTFNPSWFPDGRRILVALSKPGSFAIVTTHGKILKELRIPSRSIENGDWIVAPNGKWIALTRLRSKEQKAAIVTVRVRDGHLTRITPWSQQVGNFIDWSPDGSRLIFTAPLYKAQAGGASLNVYAIRPDGTGLAQLTHSKGGTTHNIAAAWSPDGQKIAIMRCGACNGDQTIYTMNPDGTHVTRLTPGDVPVSWGSHS